MELMEIFVKKKVPNNDLCLHVKSVTYCHCSVMQLEELTQVTNGGL